MLVPTCAATTVSGSYENISFAQENAWQVDGLSTYVSLYPNGRFYSPLQILILTPAVANETPANIAERLSNEEMMVWMKEEDIF